MGKKKKNKGQRETRIILDETTFTFDGEKIVPFLTTTDPEKPCGCSICDKRRRREGKPGQADVTITSNRFPIPGLADGAMTAKGRFEGAKLAPLASAEQLRLWWFEQADREIEGTVPKAVEYSSTDLADIGHVMARCAGRLVTDEEAAELGVFFYLQGKLSRWAGAVAAGKRPSDDTIYDIGVYCRMAQRIRATGGWPGTDKTEESVFHSMRAEPCGPSCPTGGPHVEPNYENRSAG